MNIKNKMIFNVMNTIALASLLTFSSSTLSADLPSMIDDFKHVNNTNLGTPRISISDTAAGGKTVTKINVSKGVIKFKGDIIPPRGQPGWSSLVFPLGPKGSAQDASKFSGIRLLVKFNNGNMSISANSIEVTNFDYHAMPVVVKADGKFHEVKIPFKSMRRMWSEQTKLNTQTLESFSIVAFSPQRASFDFEINEVSLY